MTPKQAKYYWQLWAGACGANHWRMERGRFAHDPQRMGEHGRQVLELAQTAEHGVVKLDLLRHAAHFLALGYDRSHNQFTNREIDRVFNLFNLLINPDDIDAVIKWDAFKAADASQRANQLARETGGRAQVIPEDPGERVRQVYFIQHAAPEAYILQVAKDKFGTKYWQSLDLRKLRELSTTLANRQAEWKAPVQSELVENPF